MTVDNTPVAVVYTVTSTGADQEFTITFPYISKSFVKAYSVTDKVETKLAYNTDYTINGQTLTVTKVLSANDKLVIFRVTDITQEILWVDGQAVHTPDIMQADDKLTHILQELAEQVDRSVKITKEERAEGVEPEYRWEEIEEAREQVLAAQSATESAKIDAELAKDEAQLARDETLDARDTALETIGTAQTEAQEAIATDKQGALDAIETGKTDAIAGINSVSQSAQQAIADDAQDAKDSIAASTATAQQTILEDSATALNAINTAAQAGVDNIDNAASGYGQAITQAKTDAIAEVDASGAEWVDKAKTEADRAKTEADRAQSIVDIGPATTEKLGLVKVGSGLSVDANGLLTAQAQPVDVATADKAGIVKPGNNMTVRTDGTLDVEIPDPPTPVDPYVLPVASENVLGGVKVGENIDIDAEGKISVTFPKPPDVPVASNTTPKAPGTASVGTETAFSRGDHVHPLQTSVSGNAGTATKLATARKINNVSFDGSADITIPVSDGKVSSKGTRTATGDWTITGLVANKPVYLINHYTGSVTDSTSYFTVIKLTGTTTDGTPHFGTGRDSGRFFGPNTITLIPSGTSITVTIGAIFAGTTIRAYQ